VAVNVLKDAHVRVLPVDPSGLNNDEIRQPQGKQHTIQMSIVEAYGRRHKRGLWQNKHEYSALQGKLDDMTLITFA
jgi:hypothetical protein